MSVKIGCLLLGIFGLFQKASIIGQHTFLPHQEAYPAVQDLAPQKYQYGKELQFNIYRFTVTAPDTGFVRDVVIKAYRR